MKISGKSILLLCFALFGHMAVSLAQDITQIEKEKPFELSGSLSVHSVFYSSTGMDARRKPFSWYLTGAPDLKIYGIDVPFSFVVSEEERSYRQPFNQFGITPSYKWAKLYLGYNNVTWSPFVWAGQTMLGAGAELTPGKVRLGFLYGRLNRAVEEDTASLEFQTPAYRRMGFVGKIGFGTDTNHVDLLFVHGKDDITSLSVIPIETEVLPAENTVIGLSAKKRIAKQFFWDLDLAASAYTRDQTSSALEGNSAGAINVFDAFATVNTSTQLYRAVQTEVRYVNKGFKVKLKYRRVDPDFKSMGAYYFQNDIENITIAPSYATKKKKLRLDVSFGKQHDNLLHKKAYTTERAIGGVGITWNPVKQFGVNLNYSNYTGDQSKGIKVPTDSLRQSFISQHLSFSPRVSIVNENYSHFFLINYNRLWLNDNNKNTAAFTQFISNTTNLSYLFTINKRASSIGANYMISSFVLDTTIMKLNGFSLVASGTIPGNKITANMSIGKSNSILNNDAQSSILNLRIGAAYKLRDAHAFSIMLAYMSNDYSDPNLKTFTELTFDLGYDYTF